MKDYVQEAYEDIEFKYHDPYWRLLTRTKWLCRRLMEHQHILDVAFVEMLWQEYERLRFMTLYFEWYQRNIEHENRTQETFTQPNDTYER